MSVETWKVGELAKRTGLSVRTLHYYEEVGLLRPSVRTEAGHRLYTEDDLVRLQRILSLRQLGFALDEIRGALDQADFALGPVIDLHLERLREQIALQQRLVERLGAVRARLTEGEPVPVTQLLETMEAITMIDKYLTPEQVAKLRTIREQQGDEGPKAFKAFVDALRAHRDAGDAPSSPAVQAVMGKWIQSSKATVGDDEALGAGLRQMLASESEVRDRFGLDEALLQYMDQAVKALN